LGIESLIAKHLSYYYFSSSQLA